MIQNHFNQTVSVDRMAVILDEDDAPTNKRSFTEHIASLPCMIQPLDWNNSKDINVGFGKDMNMFCSVVDIKEGDRVIWNSDEYRVVATRKFSYYGSPENQHMSVHIRAFQP